MGNLRPKEVKCYGLDDLFISKAMIRIQDSWDKIQEKIKDRALSFWIKKQNQ